MAVLFPLPPNTNETDTAIRRDIVLLTALLTDVRHGESTVFEAERGGSLGTDLWSYIAFVLTTGSPEDPRGSNVVAVTGRVEPASVAVTVVAGATSDEHSANRRKTPVEVDEVDLLDHAAVTYIFAHLDDVSDVTFEEHLKDVMSILSWLLRNPDSSTVLTAYFLDFIFLRCYRKLFARLQSGATLWTTHPLIALRDFYEMSTTTAAQELFPPTLAQGSQSYTPVAQAFSLRVKLHKRWFYGDLLTSHGIYPDEPSAAGEVSYTVSSSTAAAWARLLCDCYTSMVEILSQEGENGRIARRPDRRQRRALHRALALLDDALRDGIVEALFQEYLVAKLNVRYAKAMGEKTNPRLARLIDKVTTGGSATDIDYEYDPDDFQADAEDSQRHILRHLRALTMPLRAAASIVKSCRRGAPDITSLNAYVVVITPDKQDTDIPEEYFDRFKTEFARRCGGGDTIVAALEGVKGAIVKPMASVHAEAALMSLASACLPKLEVDIEGTRMPISSVLPAECIPVGISKRCCFCCWLLAELLQPGSGVAAQSGFVLRGTHGAIFPWSPPPGLSGKVLCAMREKLLEVLYYVCKASTVRSESAQTSPAPSEASSSPRSEDMSFIWSDQGLPPLSTVAPQDHDT